MKEGHRKSMIMRDGSMTLEQKIDFQAASLIAMQQMFSEELREMKEYIRDLIQSKPDISSNNSSSSESTPISKKRSQKLEKDKNRSNRKKKKQKIVKLKSSRSRNYNEVIPSNDQGPPISRLLSDNIEITVVEEPYK